jgi:hypothetical protein
VIIAVANVVVADVADVVVANDVDSVVVPIEIFVK